MEDADRWAESRDPEWFGHGSETSAPAPVRAPRFPRARRIGRILLHVALFAATAVTTTAMGTLLSVDDAATASDDAGPFAILASILASVLSNPAHVVDGLVFSFTLLAILGAHEFGHYAACRYYGVDASLPYFIPAPPPMLIGTFGAFIRIRSPFTTRRALFDIGVAGPIAGFCFAVPAAIVGIAFAAPASGAAPDGSLVFHDPLLFLAFERLFGLPPSVAWNPIYFAAWIGMFMTALNLVPVGQLDGGHAAYALFGERGHRLLSRGFFALVALLGVVAFAVFDTPVWFLYVVLLGLFAFRPHPPTLSSEPEIGTGRRVVAAVVLLIFVLSFLPVPISVA